MLCPRCHTESENCAICPNCLLDFQLYQELQGVKEEVTVLRELLNRVEPKSDHVIRDKSRPPKPPTLPKIKTRSAETAIGQRWFLGFGVLIILIGAGFFLKYAFDSRWIGPALQIAIGYISGVTILLLGEFCRQKKLKGLDIGLVTIGLGLFFLTTYAASQIYHYFPDAVALLLLLIFTILGMWRAYRWNFEAVGVLCFTGSYLAALLFRPAQLGGWMFFGYLFIINSATQSLVFVKRWTSLFVVSAGCTWLAYCLWACSYYRSTHFLQAFLFTQSLFGFYTVSLFLGNISKGTKPYRRVIVVTVLNGLFCLSNSQYLLKYNSTTSSEVAFVYALILAVLAAAYWKTKQGEWKLTWLIIQVATFLLLGSWIFFDKSWTLIFWASEMVALFLIGTKTGDSVVKGAAVITGIFTCLLLFNKVAPGSRIILFSGGWIARWITEIYVVGCFCGLTRVARGDQKKICRRCFETLAVIAIFGAMNLELWRFGNEFDSHSFARLLMRYSVCWALFAAAMIGYGLRYRRKVYRITGICLLIITFVKVLVMDTAEVSAPYRIISCLLLGAVLLGLSFVYYKLEARN